MFEYPTIFDYTLIVTNILINLAEILSPAFLVIPEDVYLIMIGASLLSVISTIRLILLATKPIDAERVAGAA